jgi:uncharacterized damage-inducible protein DinB
METPVQTKEIISPALVITPEALLEHWQGHRRLTRKVMEAFPEDKFYHYSIGGMRPFAELAMEVTTMATAGIQGIVTRKWNTLNGSADYKASLPRTRKELLTLWDQVTEQINTLWPQIPPNRFQEMDAAFGQYEGPVYWIILYWIDNEIHHRGQGYVYLRSLGIEPPAFWDRS